MLISLTYLPAKNVIINEQFDLDSNKTANKRCRKNNIPVDGENTLLNHFLVQKKIP